MGLAKYFSKDALAITQLLNQGSSGILEKILSSQVIEVALNLLNRKLGLPVV